MQLIRNSGILMLKKSLVQASTKVNFTKLYTRYKNHTMTPEQTFLDNLEICYKFKHIKGCVVECGVWRGGMIAAMAEILSNQKDYYLFDSFEGLPPAQPIDGKAAIEWQKNKDGSTYYNNCTAEMSFADEAMKMARVESYKLIKGWFSETLPNFNLENEIALLRLDADWYESMKSCLDFLYPKVKKGGIIVIDDYYIWDGCSRAIHDYLSGNNLADRIYQINSTVYIIKT